MKAYFLLFLINIIAVFVGYLGTAGRTSNHMLLVIASIILLLNIAILLYIRAPAKKDATKQALATRFSARKIGRILRCLIIILVLATLASYYTFFYKDQVVIHVGAMNICQLKSQILSELKAIEGVKSVAVTSYSQGRLLYKVNKASLAKFEISKQELVSVLSSNTLLNFGVLDEDKSVILFYSDLKSCWNNRLSDFENLFVFNNSNKRINIADMGSLHLQHTKVEQMAVNGKNAITIKIELKNPYYYLGVKQDIWDVMGYLILGKPNQMIAFQFN